MPKVSVIIPTHTGRSGVLARSTKSVLSQTFKDLELVIMDDGSTDDTKEVVKEIIEKDGRAKYYWQKNSGGAAGPKNNALKYCTGKYIAYLDSDDEWLPEKLAKQVALFDNSPIKNLGLVSCNALMVDDGGSILGTHRLQKFESLEGLLMKGGDYAYSNSTILVSRTVVDLVGDRDETLKYFEDQDYFIRIVQAGFVFDFVDEALIRYHINEDNLSRDFKNAVPDYERLVSKHLSLLQKYPKILASYYRHLGTMYLLADKKREARRCFKKSLQTDVSFRNIVTAALSLLGKGVYRILLNWKKKKALN